MHMSNMAQPQMQYTSKQKHHEDIDPKFHEEFAKFEEAWQRTVQRRTSLDWCQETMLQLLNEIWVALDSYNPESPPSHERGIECIRRLLASRRTFLQRYGDRGAVGTLPRLPRFTMRRLGRHLVVKFGDRQRTFDNFFSNDYQPTIRYGSPNAGQQRQQQQLGRSFYIDEPITYMASNVCSLCMQIMSLNDPNRPVLRARCASPTIYHHYHRDCLEQWVQTHSGTCPRCSSVNAIDTV